ncbi:hypothetical protein AMAG_13752 [Allomyces macrogynus ATCC 38327]|uniref:OPA3-like protein n=1 Tax=Allomyces macrogynus (strain ATCC 38327) TaxID=578462 RepID=A0A0L0T3R6_ALLM3|nr:hypothetical protein AMAG_13752 [Allomyces macrogynus ATCC 38327]|eukprot:KNE69387.1 hypothetical protein AMAG_13752 [Allomyces macrogynus ATCC 38327]
MSAAKVGYLFLRTMAKPIANAVKNYSKTHPEFSSRCVRFAQSVHRFETTLKSKIFETPVDYIRPLTEARALERGAAFIGEATLFALVATVVAVEAQRASRSSKRKEAVQNARIAAVEHEAQAANSEVGVLKGQIAELQAAVAQMVEEREREKMQARAAEASAAAAAAATGAAETAPGATGRWGWFW